MSLEQDYFVSVVEVVVEAAIPSTALPAVLLVVVAVPFVDAVEMFASAWAWALALALAWVLAVTWAWAWAWASAEPKIRSIDKLHEYKIK